MSYPPLKAIHYFCIAARSGSLKLAAEELNVTPGAVSQQIKTLEEWLGFRVFERSIRQVVLTEPGNVLYRRSSLPIETIFATAYSMRKISSVRTVRVTMPPAFAILCFGPILKNFRTEHPEITLQIDISTMVSSMDGIDYDLAIRYLSEENGNLDSTLLTTLEIFAVCSPEYIEQHPGLKNKNIDGCTLITDHLHPDWKRLANNGGLNGKITDKLYFDQASMSHQAAKNSLGIWLTDQVISESALADGRLEALFNVRIPSGRSLYLVHNKLNTLSDSAETVKQWFIDNMVKKIHNH